MFARSGWHERDLSVAKKTLGLYRLTKRELDGHPSFRLVLSIALSLSPSRLMGAKGFAAGLAAHDEGCCRSTRERAERTRTRGVLPAVCINLSLPCRGEMPDLRYCSRLLPR